MLSDDEKSTLDGRYCHSCRETYDCGGDFDSNSRVLLDVLVALLPEMELVSAGRGISGSATPWAGRMIRPDMVFLFRTLVLVVEADEANGHSVGGRCINKLGAPWQYSRDLNAELAKMQSAAQALSQTYSRPVMFVRCNSDRTSLRLGDTDLSIRARSIVEKVIEAAQLNEVWPSNSFRLTLVDMPPHRVQPGVAIASSDDVFISWENIQLTTAPVDPAVLKEANSQETLARKLRRATRKTARQENDRSII